MVRTGTETLSESNRELILAAATEIGAEQGYEAMSIEQVVGRAGLEREDFTNMFSGLEECLSAAMSALLTKAMAEVSSAYAPDRSEWENGIVGMKAVLELMAAHPSSAHLAYIGSRQMAPPGVHQGYETGVSVFSGLLDKLWEYSELELQPAGASRAAIGSAEALLCREVAGGRSEQLPRLLPDIIYGYTVPFLGQEEGLKLAGKARELLVGTAWE